jgi:hypothetical protein
MEAVSTSETSVNFYGTTRRNIPEDNHFLYYGSTQWKQKKGDDKNKYFL